MKPHPESPKKSKQHGEAVAPVIERTLNELLLLVGQLFVTPFAILFNTEGYRNRIATLSENSATPATSTLIARPVLFYLIWAGIYFAISGIYFKALNRDLISAVVWSDFFGHDAWTRSPGEKGLAYFSALSKQIGQSQAVVVVAFAILIIIAAKALLISLAGSAMRCRIHFNTALQASAYALGTFLFFQYMFVLAYVIFSMIFGWSGAKFGFYFLAYGSVIISIVVVIRIVQFIRMVDGTTDIQAMASWFAGTVVWHLAIIYLSVALLEFLRLNGIGLFEIWGLYFKNLFAWAFAK